MPILTKRGCNGGGCHGKAGGQNGFKLSLLGFEPQQDYETIVLENFGRRLSIASPAQSLLLLKATNLVPHVGGQRFEVESEDYRVIENWIKSGAPAPRDDDPVLESVQVEPPSEVMDPGSEKQLRVTATFSDGEIRDVTHLSVYESNDPDIAKISEAGVVEVSPVRCGVFAVMARFGNKMNVFHGTVPVGSFSEYSKKLERAAKASEIDQHLLTSWKRLGVEPSPTVKDTTFIRRATLDICGTLPTTDEVTAYESDNHPDKRARLIDRLLERPEYASFFAIKWADVLRNRGRGYGTNKQRLAAVFARLGRKGGFADAQVPTNETIYLKMQGQVVHPRTGEVMLPRPLGGEAFDLGRYEDPRRSLAQWITAAENPFFARAMVNRMWGHFFGRGIIDPIDDARSTNPPSNPELLDALARRFVTTGHDVKALIRTICNSYAYRLSSDPTPTNKADTQSFARFYPRRLSAEVLLDAMSQVLEVPTKFPGGPGEFPEGTRAIDLPDENVAVNFLDVFGRPARTKACECERVYSPSLHQALELVNSTEIQNKLTAEKGYIAELASTSAPHGDNVQQIFLRTLARPPRPQEMKTAVEFLDSETDRKEAYGTLLWSLLATNEFLFNF